MCRRDLSPRRVLVAIALLAAFAVGAGPPARKPASVARAEAEDVSGWEFYLTLPVPAGAKLADFIVPPAVFARARPELEDLRLVDGKGQPIPYALRKRAA